MLVLGIETSTMTGSVALMDEERLIAEYTLNLPRRSKERRVGVGVYPEESGALLRRKTHTSRLMSIIDRILKDAFVAIKDLDGIAVSLGPGSFTGLRIGIATAKGLAQGLNIPIVGIPTLDGLAFNLFYCKDLICPILDARKGEVYCAWYKDGKRLTKYMACEPDELLKKIMSKVSQRDPFGTSPKSLPRRQAGKVIFLGSGIEVCRDLVKKKLGKKAVFAPRSRRLTNASSIAELGLKKLKRGKKTELFTLKPIYVRAPVGK
ncbi:tRNA (adenosine(37)-N6)-threonylcarbamoyltransferase complex dimerization subunit type 1 TsaB [bacterium]|nr:tRNA (adenosine(37)-N6)-threonylcarbamoyltransferase complex dimerization subunit type 1 TsaB [bacterium]